MTMYKINDIYPAIQGEGCQTGIPMVILRLAGCDVGCPFCDTKETWATDDQNKVDEIAAALGANEKWGEVAGDTAALYIHRNYPAFQWVLLTGGEPAQQDLADLVRALHALGIRVALETSGTATGHVGAGCDWVCVSPKIKMPGGKENLQGAVWAADELKFVVGKQADLAVVDNFLQEFPPAQNTQICLQPMSAGKRSTELCLDTVMKRGWRLSIQVHKLLGER